MPNADAWELAGFPGRLDVAAYLTADQLASQYRVLVDVLLDAQEHSLTGVGRDELLAAVRDRITDATDAMIADRLTRPEAFDLDARMRTLQDWKVIIRWQDKAKTEADFIRTRDRYQLTSEAADLRRWLRRKIDEDAVSTSAAAFAPAIIAERLDDTIGASRGPAAWSPKGTGRRPAALGGRAWSRRKSPAGRSHKAVTSAFTKWQVQGSNLRRLSRRVTDLPSPSADLRKGTFAGRLRAYLPYAPETPAEAGFLPRLPPGTRPRPAARSCGHLIAADPSSPDSPAGSKLTNSPCDIHHQSGTR